MSVADARGAVPGREQASFGFRNVSPGEKTRLVGDVFESVAGRYDLMNDLMSGGLHRRWKAEFAATVAPRPGERIVDVAGGTGDIAFRLMRWAERRHGGTPDITVADINPEMLRVGRERAQERGLAGKLTWMVGNAECLPLAAASMDKYTIAFGLRNVTDVEAALRDAVRVLRPGGQWYCLEFSPRALPLVDDLYRRFQFGIIPRLGGWVAGDAEAYRYLVESIRRFADSETLVAMAAAAGLERLRVRTLAAGVVNLYSGWRI